MLGIKSEWLSLEKEAKALYIIIYLLSVPTFYIPFPSLTLVSLVLCFFVCSPELPDVIFGEAQTLVHVQTVMLQVVRRASIRLYTTEI